MSLETSLETNTTGVDASADGSSWWNQTNWFRVDNAHAEVAVVEARLCKHENNDGWTPMTEAGRSGSSGGTWDTKGTDAIGNASCFNRFGSTRPTEHAPQSKIKEVKKKKNFLNFESSQHYSPSTLKQLNELIILPLRFPHMFKAIGVKPPSGLLLTGAPGSGKTTLVKSLQDHLVVYYQQVSCSNALAEIETGAQSDDLLTLAFNGAIASQPAIIFLDELEVIAAPRQSQETSSLTRIRGILRTLMDNISSRGYNIIVIGATSSPSSICPSLTRDGRFGREISLMTPDDAGRVKILQSLTKDMKLSTDVNFNKLSEITQGYILSDLAAVCAEAGLLCIRDHLRLKDDNYSERMQDLSDNVNKELDQVQLDKLMITHQHFANAIDSLMPASMRSAKGNTFGSAEWADIGGNDHVKQSLLECVEFPIMHPQLFRKYGLSPSSGLLLYGPPGCGKTLMAKVLANECKANFLSVKGPELLSSYMGESEKNIRDLFEKARLNAPCIVFFDEMDALARTRGGANGDSQTSSAGDRILNQLLVEMDSRKDRENSPIFCIGATNRPAFLDPALLRPGRFDQLIYVGLPDTKARKAVLKAALRTTPLPSYMTDVDYEYLQSIAERTEGLSGADLGAICNRARRTAIREYLNQKSSEVMDIDTGTDVSMKNMEDVPDDAIFEGNITKEHFEEALANIRPSVSRKDILSYDYFTSIMAQQPEQRQGNVDNASGNTNSDMEDSTNVSKDSLTSSIQLWRKQTEKIQKARERGSESGDVFTEVYSTMQEIILNLNDQLAKSVNNNRQIEQKLLLSVNENQQLRNEINRNANAGNSLSRVQ